MGHETNLTIDFGRNLKTDHVENDSHKRVHTCKGVNLQQIQ